MQESRLLYENFKTSPSDVHHIRHTPGDGRQEERASMQFQVHEQPFER